MMPRNLFLSHVQVIAIGWHWCAYVENTARGWGIKDVWYKPYREFVEPVTAFNKYIYDKV